MAVAYESDGGTVWAAAASNAAISVPLPATRPVGSVLILVAWNRLITSSVTTAPTGYTLLSGLPTASATASGGKLWIYARIVDGTESAPTIAMDGATGTTGDIWGACIYCYSGGRPTVATILDGTAGVQDALNTTTCTFPAVSAKGPGAMVVRTLARFRDAADTFTPTATWNEREDASTLNRTGGQHFLQDKPATAGGLQAAVTVAPSNTTSARNISATLILNFPPVLEQEGYRFRNDDGDETAATWRQAVNTPDAIGLNTSFRIRFAVENTAGGTAGSLRIQFRLKPSGGSFGAWTNVSAATSVAPALSSHYANLDATTQQIGAGTFDVGVMIEGDVVLLASADLPVTLHSEFEFLLTASSANGAATGDTYEFRLVENLGTTAFASYTQTPSLTIGVAGTNWTQPVDDTLTLADAATTESGKAVSIPDTLAVADALASQAVFARTVNDPVALADATAFQRDVALPLADTLALADLVATQRGIVQAVADTLTLADLATTAAGKGITLADSLALADTATSQAAFVRGLADTLSLADTLAAQSAFQLAIVDTLNLADALGSQAAFARALADTLTLADLADPVKGVGGVDHTQPIADVVALADALTAGSTLARAIADTLAVADSLTAQKAILRDLADTVSLADTLRFGRALGLTDTVALADAVAFQAAYLRTLADAVSLTDAATAGLQLTRAIADTVALLDSLAATLGRAVTLEDVLALTDEFDALLTAAIGAPPRASGLIDFPGVGIITRPTHGARVGNNRGNINTAGEGVLTKPTRGAT